MHLSAWSTFPGVPVTRHWHPLTYNRSPKVLVPTLMTVCGCKHAQRSATGHKSMACGLVLPLAISACVWNQTPGLEINFWAADSRTTGSENLVVWFRFWWSSTCQVGEVQHNINDDQRYIGDLEEKNLSHPTCYPKVKPCMSAVGLYIASCLPVFSPRKCKLTSFCNILSLYWDCTVFNSNNRETRNERAPAHVALKHASLST